MVVDVVSAQDIAVGMGTKRTCVDVDVKVNVMSPSVKYVRNAVTQWARKKN